MISQCLWRESDLGDTLDFCNCERIQDIFCCFKPSSFKQQNFVIPPLTQVYAFECVHVCTRACVYDDHSLQNSSVNLMSYQIHNYQIKSFFSYTLARLCLLVPGSQNISSLYKNVISYILFLGKLANIDFYHALYFPDTTNSKLDCMFSGSCLKFPKDLM